MIKEFNSENQAKAIADSLGLFITKYKEVYLVSNSKEELLVKYNLAYYSKDGIFYDREVFKEDADGFLVIKNKKIIDASSVELPYIIKNCSYMFAGCTSLKTPPTIPEGVKDCSYMFDECTSLKIPPIIPEGVADCAGMFNECISLETPPIIPESVKDCYSMFCDCSSLEIPPKIPEGTQSCHFMFEGCTSLKKRPRLPENSNTTGALKGTPFWQSSTHHGSLNIFP